MTNAQSLIRGPGAQENLSGTVVARRTRARLQGLVSNGAPMAHTHIHARILLKADEGPDGQPTDAMISSALDVGMSTVARVRQTAVQEGPSLPLQRKLPKRVYSLAHLGWRCHEALICGLGL